MAVAWHLRSSHTHGLRAGRLAKSRAQPRKYVYASAAVESKTIVKDIANVTVQGTSRRVNEDRSETNVFDRAEGPGAPVAYAAVFDGHGGAATAEWLEERFWGYVEEFWDAGAAPEQRITDAFLQADKKLLSPARGFFGGMGERGVGGSKCGATGAVALIYKAPHGRSHKLLTANAGDARVILARKGKAVQLTEDHVPDSEDERLRIERYNPNPKMPLVRYVGGTWRVGGLLALSRAFGDSYLKGPLQFEGVQAGGDGYSSGFGVIAQPYTQVTDLTDGDSWVFVASDGLFENEVRGGGGGLSNQEVVDMALAAGSKSAEDLAIQLVEAAQEAGSTDDITLLALRL